METNVTITIKAEEAAAYIASLDMAIALCEQKTTHVRAGDYLRTLRAELMEVYTRLVN